MKARPPSGASLLHRPEGSIPASCALILSPNRPLRMRPPWRGVEQLHFLGHQQRAELRGKALDKILVRIDRGPMRAAVGIVVEFPQMHELVDRAGVALEIPDELSVLAAPLE